MQKISVAVLICTGVFAVSIHYSLALSTTPAPDEEPVNATSAEVEQAVEEETKLEDIKKVVKSWECRKGFKGIPKLIKQKWHHCRRQHHIHGRPHHETFLCKNLCVWKQLGYMSRDGHIANEEKVAELSKLMYPDDPESAAEKTKDFVECHKEHHHHLEGDHHQDKCVKAKEINTCMKKRLEKSCEEKDKKPA